MEKSKLPAALISNDSFSSCFMGKELLLLYVGLRLFSSKAFLRLSSPPKRINHEELDKFYVTSTASLSCSMQV